MTLASSRWCHIPSRRLEMSIEYIGYIYIPCVLYCPLDMLPCRLNGFTVFRMRWDTNGNVETWIGQDQRGEKRERGSYKIECWMVVLFFPPSFPIHL